MTKPRSAGRSVGRGGSSMCKRKALHPEPLNVRPLDSPQPKALNPRSPNPYTLHP